MALVSLRAPTIWSIRKYEYKCLYTSYLVLFCFFTKDLKARLAIFQVPPVIQMVKQAVCETYTLPLLQKHPSSLVRPYCHLQYALMHKQGNAIMQYTPLTIT